MPFARVDIKEGRAPEQKRALAQAMGLLRESGATDPAATLRPLLTAALDNALNMGDDALTHVGAEYYD